ncbi:conserved hypothetical protein [Ricinus communis]|uniref:Retrotransposon gag domain-containing protein n=1 Tax=Ricinus communis TaxID=3988 RepID=B9RB01_RICCO|nr:conserved hypothetical protein [Ricinus communis]
MAQMMEMMKSFNPGNTSRPPPLSLPPESTLNISKPPTTQKVISISRSNNYSGKGVLPPPAPNLSHSFGVDKGIALLFSIPEDHKIDLTSLYLGEKADIWFQGWQAQHPKSSWIDFLEELCKRFGELTVEDVVEEFNKIKQKETLIEYQEKFEELKSLMLKYHPWFG